MDSSQKNKSVTGSELMPENNIPESVKKYAFNVVYCDILMNQRAMGSGVVLGVREKEEYFHEAINECIRVCWDYRVESSHLLNRIRDVFEGMVLPMTSRNIERFAEDAAKSVQALDFSFEEAHNKAYVDMMRCISKWKNAMLSKQDKNETFESMFKEECLDCMYIMLCRVGEQDLALKCRPGAVWINRTNRYRSHALSKMLKDLQGGDDERNN